MLSYRLLQSGQRVRLRVLFVQKEIAGKNHSNADRCHAGIIHGDPGVYQPTWTRHRSGALIPLNGHLEKMPPQAKLLYQLPLADS